MADRVRRPADYEALMLELTKEHSIFKTYKDLMVFAACLGYRRDKRVEFQKSAEPINLQIFSGTFDQAVINTLAIATTNDSKVIGEDQEDERIRIFEEFACGGLEIMADEIGGGSVSSWGDALLTSIMQEENQDDILNDITSLGG